MAQQQAELLPAQAPEKIGDAQALLQDLTDVQQRQVASLVPPPVIDLLESLVLGIDEVTEQ